MATILIVDDHSANREYLVTLLGYGGHRLLQASDGIEGLAVAIEEQPNLVIADILMPTMDGFEFARRLRATPPIASTRIIFYTAHYLAQEVDALARECGVDQVLTKPAEPEEVLRAVEVALGGGTSVSPLVPAVPEAFDQEHLRLLTDTLARKSTELGKTNERLDALIQLSLQLGSERDPERLLQSFCASAREVLGARCAAVGILSTDEAQLKRFTSAGIDRTDANRLRVSDPRLGVLATILDGPRPVRVPGNDGEVPAIQVAPAFWPFQSFLGVPVQSPSRVYGWLCLVDRFGASEFSAEDEYLADILAAMAGRIYENGSLYAEMLRHSQQLEAEVLERSRVEEALRESEERTRLVLETANDAFITINPEGKIIQWNRQAEVLFGWSSEEAIGQELPETIIPPRFRDAHRRGVKEYRLTRRSQLVNQRFETTALRRDQREFPVEILIWPTDVGDTYTISGFIRDITERKLAEETLRYTTQKARCLLWYSEIEETGERYLRWRSRLAHPDAAQAFFPLEVGPEEGYLDAWLRARPREGLREMADAVNDAVRAGEGYSNEFQARDQHGNDRWLHEEVQVEKVGDGEWRAVGVVTDITERKQLEEQYRQSQLRLEHVITSSPAVLYTLSAHEGILKTTWISPNLRELLGYEAEEVYQVDWWAEHVHPEDNAPAWARVDAHLHADGYVENEFRICAKDGKYRWIRNEMRLLRDTQGRPEEVVGSWSDITERKQLEEQFHQAQKMETVGRLAGGIAHDFNNMLAVIMGYGELVLRRFPEPDPCREMIGEIVGAGKRAAALTRQLLVLSRKAIVEPRILDLREVVTDMDRMLRRIIGEDIQLTTTADPNLGSAKVDLSQIEQVLLNLVVNARDAMPGGGFLTIELQNVELDQRYAQEHPEARPGRYVMLAVTDTGCGMDSDTRTRVFEPFFTTKGERGTGLGLATVYGIARQSGGHVTVYSEVGTGTCFKVYLPRADQAPDTEGELLTADPLPRGDETVLLVEDEEAMRLMAKLILQECGYTVLEAVNGKDALRVFEQHGKQIDLLITDVVMPQMSGRELAEQLETSMPELKVLYISGYTDDAVVQHGILQAEVSFLQKPFLPDGFARKVREVLGNSRAH